MDRRARDQGLGDRGQGRQNGRGRRNGQAADDRQPKTAHATSNGSKSRTERGLEESLPAPDISPREWNMIGDRLGIPDRQVEIMEQFIAGVRKPKDIAPILGIKVCTVKTHIQRMYKKLGVKARSDAVVLALLALLEIRSGAR